MNGMGSSNLGHLINHAFLKSLCRMLGFVAIGDATCPDQGQTTINVLQETNKGLLFIRFNPTLKDKLETGCAIFEIESLCFFAKNKIPVPIPLKFGDEFYYETDKWIICAYFCLPGLAINRSELSVSLAVKMGEFLCKVVEVSAKYPSERTSKEQFLNSFKYIIEVAEKIEKSVPELEHSKLWNIMKMTTETNQDILKNTPKGIVHADYFYENILKDQNGNIVGLIDFGDAYHGHILHDVAIGAMESCILEGEVWNLEIFRAFLHAISSFLITNSISFKQFYETLKVNCLRFLIYTLSNTLTQGLSINCNIYLKRYEKLMSKNFEENIQEIYTNIFTDQNMY